MIQECVKYVRVSEARKIKFAECIARVSMHCKKKIQQDVATRRNSTYLVCETALEHCGTFDELQLVHPNFKCSLSDEEWNKVGRICLVLKPFYDITTIFSGSYYPTPNLYFHGVWKIQHLIFEGMHSLDDDMVAMAMKMDDKFNKYWENYSLVLSFAIILNPRFKLQWLEFFFKKIYPTSFKQRAVEINQKLHFLFEEYMRIYFLVMAKLSLGASAAGGVTSDIVDEIDEYNRYESENYQLDRNTSQLDLYLNENRLEAKEELDVLKFWKENRSRYPVISLMARDILSIPITTMALESAFSVGGRVINNYRSSILLKNVEALICTKDWLYGGGALEENADEEAALTTDFAPLIATLGGSS
ncbi:hypothetical protein ACH5RR_038953 [Cinchona calisaya]|uniref:Transposase n=1 Tax=Cinchona calisaya TaxID=153742 RepID=A0ABD2Y0W7_9GENT